ncbi:MAG: alpha/beta hydrolase [Devosia sp.]|uniref:alpha/beta hydrolase n=1 Tax=Devosia sp. TaxID=1871048 RepID=UPI002630FEE8|nr:alpha/beta hydrolase [Devosia sp.]MDB5587315.1 alpha/beta hydrolase [Devosia sp.]
MFRFPLLHSIRGVVVMLALLLASGPALALSIMDPFNLPGAMDGGTSKVGDGIAYADGPRFKLDVYAPEARGAPAPVVFFIYGGGWSHGDRGDYQFVGRALAARGFVAVIADYRLFPEVKYPDFLDDNAKALRWVQDNIANYGGDPERLFLAGHSAGAYNAVMLALDQSFLKDYGVTMPIRAVAALSGPFDFYPFEYDEVRNTFGSASNPEGTQPINLVTSDAPPMFLATGTGDPIVRMQNTEHLARALQARGTWVTTKFYEGFGHMEVVMAMGSLWRWRMPVLDDVTLFFNQFGAFPSGVPYIAVAPQPPDEVIEPMDDIIAQMDQMFQPVSK